MFRPGSRALHGLTRYARPETPRLFARHYSRGRSGSNSMIRGLERQSREKLVQSEAEIKNQTTVQPTVDEIRKTMGFIPGTFVSMPLSQIPKSPVLFFTYQWYALKSKAMDLFSVLGIRWQSKPGFLGKARLPIKRAPALAAGKALHARLNQAIAEGDRDTLRQITVPRLLASLSGVVARRSSSQRVSWEIVEHHGARLVSHRATPLPPPCPKNVVIEQAVVAMDTTQKLQRIDTATNEVIPASTKMQRRTEYLGIHRILNKATYEMDPWAVIGNTKETTLHDWQEWVKYEQDHNNSSADKQLKLAKEKRI